MFSKWSRWLNNWSGRSSRRSRRLARRPYRPATEQLETRQLLANFIVGPTVNISRSTHPEAEGTLKVNPTDPSKLFAVANSSDSNTLSAAYSTDGGTTWNFRQLGGADGLPGACCDGQATFDQFGNLFLTYLSDSLHTVVVMSTDSGKTFQTQVIFDNGAGSDQPSVATGPGDLPGSGSVWVDWNQGGMRAVGARVTGLGQVGSFSTPQLVPGANQSFGICERGVALRRSGSPSGW
jgi:hypothetical protein